jgi:hypothetical protein
MYKESEDIQKELIRERNSKLNEAIKYEVDMDENELEKEFNKICEALDKVELNISIKKYFI